MPLDLAIVYFICACGLLYIFCFVVVHCFRLVLALVFVVGFIYFYDSLNAMWMSLW
jgi:hypothetical protein